MSAPLVSIIVPARDAERTLPAALKSIAQQSGAETEVVVVDCGSATLVDGLVRALIPEAINARLENAGLSSARNHAVRLARGAFIAFLDAEDLWPANTLATLLSGFRNAPGVAVVQGLIRRFSAIDASDAAANPPYAGCNLGALMVRADAMRRLGPFDEERRASGDGGLFIRIREHDLRHIVLPQVTLLHRQPAAPRSGVAPLAQRYHALPATSHRSAEAFEAAAAAPETPTSITVALAVKDGARYLPGALRSIRAQTLAPVEILAVAGASSDGTLELLAAQPDVRLIPDRGTSLAEARNQAIEAARGEFIAFLDHDDLWRRSKLRAQAGVLAHFTQPAACITLFRDMRDADPDDPAKVIVDQDQVPRLGWTPSTLMAHREVFRAVGPFDAELGLGCDSDWFRRLWLSKIPCGLASQPLVGKRRHARNLSRDAATNRTAMFRMIAKHRTERREHDAG